MTEVEVHSDENKPKGKKKKNNAVKKKKTPKNAKVSATLEEGDGVKRNQKGKTKKMKKVAKQQTVSADQELQNSGSDENENVLNPTDTPDKPKSNKHVVFDDDETFDNLPDLSSFAAAKTLDMKEEEESDSDAPPDEETISTGKDIFAEEDRKMRGELIKLKNQVREARRLKHEKNREQQKKKKERLQKLEESRLPTDLLNAVVMEKDEPKEDVVPTKKKKKRKHSALMIGDDDLITLERGVKVKAVEQEVKKFTSIASIAAEFRQNALYNKQINRMSSWDQRMMNVKQKKSGKT